MRVVDKDGILTRVGTPSLTEQLAEKAKLKLDRGDPKQAKAEKARRRVITLACQARAEAKRLANAPKNPVPVPNAGRAYDGSQPFSWPARPPRKSGRPGRGVCVTPDPVGQAALVKAAADAGKLRLISRC